MYKLFTDKAELFECDIKIEGASLSNSKARLVVETNDYSLNKSISACVIAQKNTSKSKNIEEIKKYCEKEIKKKLSN